MATGKTNARHIKVYVDDSGSTARDITASVSNITGTGLTFAEQDVTAFSDGVVNFTLGQPSSTIEVSGPFNNTATTGGHTVFSGIVGTTTTRTVTVQVGIRAAATTGDPEFEGEYICSNYVVAGDGTYTALLVPGSSTVPAWGTVA